MLRERHQYGEPSEKAGCAVPKLHAKFYLCFGIRKCLLSSFFKVKILEDYWFDCGLQVFIRKPAIGWTCGTASISCFTHLKPMNYFDWFIDIRILFSWIFFETCFFLQAIGLIEAIQVLIWILITVVVFELFGFPFVNQCNLFFISCWMLNWKYYENQLSSLPRCGC